MLSTFGLFDQLQYFKNQNYFKIKERLLKSKSLFVDPEFPTNLKSLFASVTPKDIQFNPELKEIVWKRPRDICDKPFLFVNGVSSSDVLQGRLGNCWFVAACCCVTVYKENWMTLIPDYKTQEWGNADYCGIFKFRFWRYGFWVEVVIDDQLPTINNELLYCHSNYKNEFWSALLEKAYAKLIGCYESLEGGELMESLVDFTGGLPEPIIISGHRQNEDLCNRLFLYLMKEHGCKSLIAAAIPALTPEEQEKEIENGLIIGHAYAVTMVIELPVEMDRILSPIVKARVQNSKIKMIRLKNPWGQGEWKGSFCDGSIDWNCIPKLARNRVGLIFQDDGEFWMPFMDFVDNFISLIICHQIGKMFNNLFYENVFHGIWKNQGAGGCLNFKDTFLNNPQYAFTIDNPDGEEVLFNLTQKMNRVISRHELVTGLYYIGFSILKVECNRMFRVKRLDYCQLSQSSPFKNARSIFLRATFTRGRYVLIPCTFQPGQMQSFMLRIYCRSQVHAMELLEQNQPVPTNVQLSDLSIKCMFNTVRHSTHISRITIFKATKLPRVDPLSGANPYLVLLCEDQRCTSSICRNTLEPEWEESFVFYRRHVNKEPIVILIYSKYGVLDEFLGKQVITGPWKGETQILEYKLLDRYSSDTYTAESSLDSVRSNFQKQKGSIFIQLKTVNIKKADDF